MIVERTLPFDHQLSFSLSLFKFFMTVDDSFSRLTMHMIVRDCFSVCYFGNHWPDSSQKTCCRPLLSRKIHTLQVCLTGHHLAFAFLHKKAWNSLLSWLCLRDCRWIIVNYHQLLWPFDHLNDSWWWLMILRGESTIIEYHAPFDQGLTEKYLGTNLQFSLFTYAKQKSLMWIQLDFTVEN